MNFAAFIFFLPLLLLCAADLDCFYGEMEVERNGTMVCEKDPSYLFEPRVLGCTIPSHSLIMRDQIVFLGQKMYECQTRRDGKDVELVVTMNEEAVCDNGVRSGASWIEADAFKYICAPYGQIHFVACITPGGTEIPPQETKQIGHVNVTCTRYNNGTVAMTANKQSTEYNCKSWTGESKPYGSYWIEKKYIGVNCTEWGHAELFGCDLTWIRFASVLEFRKYYTSGPAYFFCDQKKNKYTFHINDPHDVNNTYW